MPRPVIRGQRREQIIRAALRLVRRVGVHGFSTADVADEAGVSRGILHYHFVSKDEIIREALLLLLIEFGRRAGEAVVATSGTARVRLHALADAAMHEDEAAFYATLLEFWSPARRIEAYRTTMARLYDGWIAFIAGVIREGETGGETGGEAVALVHGTPEDAACALVALTDGLMVQSLIRRDWMPAARARRIVHAAIDAWFPIVQ